MVLNDLSSVVVGCAARSLKVDVEAARVSAAGCIHHHVTCLLWVVPRWSGDDGGLGAANHERCEKMLQHG